MRSKARLLRILAATGAVAVLGVGYQSGSTFKVLAASESGTSAGLSRTEFALAADSTSIPGPIRRLAPNDRSIDLM